MTNTTITMLPEAHGVVEPVEKVFRSRSHVEGHVDHGVASVRHECHRLFLLAALILQHLVQSELKPTKNAFIESFNGSFRD